MRMDIDALRDRHRLCRRIHLNNAGAALMSQRTLDAMTAHLRREAEIGGTRPPPRRGRGRRRL